MDEDLPVVSINLKRVVAYTSIMTSDASKFERLVRAGIKEGWTPQGGMSSTVVDGEEWFYQAMVKYEKNN